MFENELTKKLRAELNKQAGDNPFYQHIADFMYFAATSGNHIDVMNDIISGKLDVASAFDAAQDVAEEQKKSIKGNCAVLDAPTVYGIVAEYLGLKTCISGEEIKAYCIGELTGETGAADTPKASETENNSVSLDLGLDDLFDD